MILELIEEAVISGARLAPACQMVGLSVRTVQRWRAASGGEDGRQGPKTNPRNKLSPAEELFDIRYVYTNWPESYP